MLALRQAAVVGALLLCLPACKAKKSSSTTPPINVPTKAGCNPFSTAGQCLFPFPSSFFQTADSTSPTGFRVNYPDGIFGTSNTGTAIDVTPYNTADGSPPISPILLFYATDVNLTNLPGQHQIDQSTAADAPIAIIDLETGNRVPYFAEMEENRNSAYPNRNCFIIRPVAPMQMGHRHAVMLTDSVTLATGDALPVPAAFAALRDKTITTNPVIEDVRSLYETIFTQIEKLGYAREHVALAFDFMVASETYLLGPIESMRTQTLTETGPNGEGYVDGGLTYTMNTPSLTSTGGMLVEGNFQVTNYIDPTTNQFHWDTNHLPIEQPANDGGYEYTLYIPPEDLADGGTPLPIGIFGHGLLGTGRGYLDTGGPTSTTIQTVADRAGVALIATDWIGLSGTLDDQLVGGQVASDINQLGMVTERLTQSLINNLAMTKLARGGLQNDPRIQPADKHALFDLAHTFYYGVSLGGIQGASLVSISDDISRGVLAVPGAGWSTMFPRSYDWLLFQSVALATYPDPLQETEILALMQARFDFTDGANLTKLMLQEPLAGAPAKAVVLQESIDDCQVQNISTETLARSIGVQQMTPAYETIFPLDAATSPTTSSVVSQYALITDMDRYAPPLTDVAAAMDNGAHSDLTLQPESQAQIVQFLQTGSIQQFCDGGDCVIDIPDGGIPDGG